jgi:hypothetical protein
MTHVRKMTLGRIGWLTITGLARGGPAPRCPERHLSQSLRLCDNRERSPRAKRMQANPRLSILTISVLVGVSLGCAVDNRTPLVAGQPGGGGDGGSGGRGGIAGGHGGKGAAGRAGSADAGHDVRVSTGIPIAPNAAGYFDGTNAAGIVGAWWSTGDDYASRQGAGTGNCPTAKFPNSECSSITTPDPTMPFTPGPNGMCTSGTAAQVIPYPSDAGVLAYSSIWGNMIGFSFNSPMTSGADAGLDGGDSSVARVEAGAGGLDAGDRADGSSDSAPHASAPMQGLYDALAHGVTGVAFDIDNPPVPNLRVEFQTLGTENNAAYWNGAVSQSSPVAVPGHYEIRWPQVGGPFYLINNGTTPPPFDATKLEAMQFHVPSNPSAAVSYSFCVRNIIMLTN